MPGDEPETPVRRSSRLATLSQSNTSVSSAPQKSPSRRVLNTPSVTELETIPENNASVVTKKTPSRKAKATPSRSASVEVIQLPGDEPETPVRRSSRLSSLSQSNSFVPLVPSNTPSRRLLNTPGVSELATIPENAASVGTKKTPLRKAKATPSRSVSVEIIEIDSDDSKASPRHLETVNVPEPGSQCVGGALTSSNAEKVMLVENGISPSATESDGYVKRVSSSPEKSFSPKKAVISKIANEPKVVSPVGKAERSPSKRRSGVGLKARVSDQIKESDSFSLVEMPSTEINSDNSKTSPRHLETENVSELNSRHIGGALTSNSAEEAMIVENGTSPLAAESDGYVKRISSSPEKSVSPKKAVISKIASSHEKSVSPKKAVISKIASSHEKSVSPKKVVISKIASSPEKSVSPKKAVISKITNEQKVISPIGKAERSPSKRRSGVVLKDRVSDQFKKLTPSNAEEVMIVENGASPPSVESDGYVKRISSSPEKSVSPKKSVISKISIESNAVSSVGKAKRTPPKRLSGVGIEDRVLHQIKRIDPFSFIEMPSVEKFFENREANASKLLDQIVQSYSDVNSLNLFQADLPDELIVKNHDTELIWQQLSFQNNVFLRKMKKMSKLLDVADDSIDEEVVNQELTEDEEEDEVDEEVPSDDGAEDEEECNLLELTESDLHNLDAQLKALDDESDSEVPKKKKKTHATKKSAVDDEFFNQEEMENFLDEQDEVDDVVVTDNEDDDADFETNYRYNDFYEPEANEGKQKRKVSFAPDTAGEDNIDEEDDLEEEEDEYEEIEESGPVLIGGVEQQKTLTSHGKTKKKLEEAIERIQRENMNPRSWELSGEITGDARSKDSLLEKYVEVDFKQRNPPINSQEKSDKILAIVLKRNKDKLFDDVVRKYREDNTVQPYRNLTVDMTERKTLSAVYEDRFNAAQNGENDFEDIDPQTKEVNTRVSKLFEKLDAMIHMKYAPSKVSEEIKMVKNMPSMRAEEVGPLAAVGGDESVLAPEEVSRHMRAAPMAKEERTKTDKKRERRKKKAKQTVLSKIGKLPKIGKEKQLEDQADAAKKSNKKTKTVDFFGQMQDIAVKAVKEKSAVGKVIKKKKTVDRSETAAKYKA